MADSTKNEHNQMSVFGNVTDKAIEGIESDLAQIAKDFGELALDLNLDPGLLKDIPVVRTGAGIVSLIGKIRDAFFALKLKRAFQASNSEQRQKLSHRLKSDETFAKKVVEKFLLLIDKTTDTEKCELLGKVVAAFADEQIDGNTLTRLFDAIDRMFLPDLPTLLEFYNIRGKTAGFIEVRYNSLQNLGMCGLVTLHFVNASGWVGMHDEFNINALGSDLVTIVQDGKPPSRSIDTTEGKT